MLAQEGMILAYYKFGTFLNNDLPIDPDSTNPLGTISLLFKKWISDQNHINYIDEENVVLENVDMFNNPNALIIMNK